MSSLDIHVLEVLASKICHDLISPIGAVNNGVEFVQEMGLEDAGDAFDLIAFSAQQASAKLQAYRMAYGAGGADDSIKPEDVYDAIEGIIAPDNKIKQDWDKDAPIGLNQETFERPRGFAKILISALLLVMDSLPKGGTIKVSAEGDKDFTVEGTGENASFRAGVADALSGKTKSDDLEPQYVHAYVLGLLLSRYDFSIELDNDTDDAVFIHVKL